MKFGIKKRPLLSCIVTHSLPGRVRLNSRAIKYLKNDLTEITERINNISAIKSSSLSAVTGSILVIYDKELTRQEVKEILIQFQTSCFQKGFNTHKEALRKFLE